MRSAPPARPTPPPRTRERAQRRWRERGSALVEGAIVIPVLVLLLYWSAAITDVMVLKLKGQEAARFAIWEMTVFRSPAQISADVRARFADLRSPASENKPYTGLMLYPKASNVVWSAQVQDRGRKVSLGGTWDPPGGATGIGKYLGLLLGFLSRNVDAAMARQQFNVYGYAEATARLDRASHLGSAILNGGDLLGNKGSNDLDHPASMANFSFQTPLRNERPMRLVFDTWKAWPKPAAYTFNGAPTNVNVAPAQSYPVVEEQVADQADKIAFFGIKRNATVAKVTSALNKLFNSAIGRGLAGGHLPDLFSSRPMDDKRVPSRAWEGPTTILPVEKPDVPFAPGGALGSQRLGRSVSNSVITGDDTLQLTGSVDRSRYTVPYKINTRYWTADGGATLDTLSGRTSPVKGSIAQQNEYTRAFACRGHYFAGATGPQQADSRKRYRASCQNR